MNNDLKSPRLSAVIVEDEQLIAEELRDRLEGLGFSVVATVDSAADGIAVTLRERPDLVLMDIRLKGDTDGVEAAQEIRRQVDVPIVYLTAYSDAETVDRARGSEYDGFILKPFQRRELQSTIDVAMRRFALRSGKNG